MLEKQDTMVKYIWEILYYILVHDVYILNCFNDC